MKLSKLLAIRQDILRQASLANLADAYVTLKRLGDRVASNGLCGAVTLQAADPSAEHCAASLNAIEGNQSVIEEHFTDEEITAMTDAIVLAIETQFSEVEFRIEQLAEKFVAPLRAALDGAGVVVDEEHEHPTLAAESPKSRLYRRKRS